MYSFALSDRHKQILRDNERDDNRQEAVIRKSRRASVARILLLEFISQTLHRRQWIEFVSKDLKLCLVHGVSIVDRPNTLTIIPHLEDRNRRGKKEEEFN
jgi:hypothetical protein